MSQWMPLNGTIQTVPTAPPPAYLLIPLGIALIGLKLLALSVYALACSFRSARVEADPARRAYFYAGFVLGIVIMLGALVFALIPRHA
jgi:hypothetical protein